MAHGDDGGHEELTRYANLANIDQNEVLEELLNKPNVSDFAETDINHKLLPLTTELVKIIHNEPDFQSNVLSKLSFGTALITEMKYLFRLCFWMKTISWIKYIEKWS